MPSGENDDSEPEPKRRRYNTTKVTNLARATAAKGASRPTAATLCNTHMMDRGELCDTTRLNSKKIERQQKRDGRYLHQKNLFKIANSTCLGVDGREDDVVSIMEKESLVAGSDNKTVKVTKKGKEKHLTILAFPSGRYVTHMKLQDGKGKTQADAVIDTAKEIKSLDSLMMILCDGTLSNTGWDNGMVACMEKVIKRALHRQVCTLHFIGKQK